MTPYIAIAELPEEFSSEFLQTIPAHRMVVNDYLERGIISSYSLAADRSMLWINITAENEDEAAKIEQRLPISNFVEFDVRELLFYNSSGSVLPQIILN